MHDLRELRRENRSLRDRFARLSGTVLRINSSLDLDTVLKGVVDSARALTAAGQGVITTVDAGGGVADFVTSGLSDEQVQALVEWTDGPRTILPGRRGCPGWPGDQTGEARPESVRDRLRRRRTWTAQHVSRDWLPEPSRDSRRARRCSGAA